MSGIATNYPNDKNIGSDPAVVFADNFENYTSESQLVNHWSRVQGVKRIRITTTQHFSGTKCAEFQLPVSSSEQVSEIFKDFLPGHDTLFCRTYMKWDSGYHLKTSNHNGIHMRGGTATAGVPCDGIKCFVMLVQNNNIRGEAPPGYLHEYAYWPSQRGGYGDHWYPDGTIDGGGKADWLLYPAKYPDFKPLPMFLPLRNKWYCYEQMVKLNTIGQNDGEVKVWVDGILRADWTNLVIHQVDPLKIDSVSLDLHSIGSDRLNKKWYDNVVIATSYIGPMVR